MEQRARQFTILLIGGVSGVGKSETAAALSRLFGIPWLQVDDLRLALQFSGLVSREKHPELFSFLDRSDWQTPPETYRDKLIAVGQAITGALRVVIESHVATNVPVIIEGDGILPEFAATIAREYDERIIQSVFIVEDDADFLFANMLQRGRGIDPNAVPALRRTEAHAKALFSRWLAHEAGQYRLTTIRPLPWETLPERVIASCSDKDDVDSGRGGAYHTEN